MAPDEETRSADMPHYTREWHFDPYHQRLSFARQHGPARPAIDTEWGVWEVFQQAKRGEHHRHVGSVHASDPEMALVLAKESFARRGDCVNLWVVAAEAIHATAYEDADVFAHTTDKSYREPGGYHGLRKTKIHGREREEDMDRGHVDSVLRSAEDADGPEGGSGRDA